MEGRNLIKSVQMGFFTFFAQTGVNVVMLPSLLAKKVGHDGWISVLFTGIFVLLLSMLALVLLKRYSDKDIYDINKMLFGKIIGFGFNFLFFLYLISTTIAGTSLFIRFIKITLLQATPPWIFVPLISLPSIYLVWQGLKYMARYLQISIINYFLIIVLFVLLYKSYRFSFLLPLGQAGALNIIKSMKTSFFAFTGFELILLFYPFITDRNKALKWQLGATMASTLFYILVIVVSTSVFGEHLLRVLSMPFYNLSRVYNAPILERVDLYIIAIWYVPMACSMRCYVFAAFNSLQKVFALPKTKPLYLIYVTTILFLGLVPKDINQVFAFVELNNYIRTGIAVFIVLCLMLSFIRKKGAVVT